MKRILTLLALLALSAGLDFGAGAQEIPDSVRTASADTLASAPSDSIAAPVMRRPPAVPLDPIQASSIAQVRLLIRSGEYSGITWAGGSQYAVVHVKGNGGGIYSFVVYTDSTGIPSSVLAYELEAGRNSKESSLDNEDVVYVPSRRSLFVVSEAQQSIREYDLFGKPTGAQLEVPSAFAKANITSGHGFESLAYNESTGLFWTTTEAPLKGEEFHRLQSFRADSLLPAAQFLYEPSPAEVPAEKTKKAKAYVKGLSAMTALDDGRLIVMERELYVPSGRITEMFTGAFSKTSLYEVDPSRSSGELLEKRELLTFYTTALNLANFEGMCLGPTLADGSRLLLLIADSQGGMNGLVGEYLKFIKLRL